MEKTGKAYVIAAFPRAWCRFLSCRRRLKYEVEVPYVQTPARWLCATFSATTARKAWQLAAEWMVEPSGDVV
jgi:hypothetical protein